MFALLFFKFRDYDNQYFFYTYFNDPASGYFAVNNVKMNIAIIGASSGVGLHTVKQALERGHHVTTLSRRLHTIPDHPLINKVRGTATDIADVKKVITGADAVIITIGKSKDKAPTLFPDTTRALITAAKGLSIPFIIITGFGAGDSLQYSNNLLLKIILG
jgi:putative NADH-flavin reductase